MYPFWLLHSNKEARFYVHSAKPPFLSTDESDNWIKKYSIAEFCHQENVKHSCERIRINRINRKEQTMAGKATTRSERLVYATYLLIMIMMPLVCVAANDLAQTHAMTSDAIHERTRVRQTRKLAITVTGRMNEAAQHQLSTRALSDNCCCKL